MEVVLIWSPWWMYVDTESGLQQWNGFLGLRATFWKGGGHGSNLIAGMCLFGGMC